MKNYFISSTGTDIGKTYVLCSMIKSLISDGKSVNAIKPFISGYCADDETSDTHRIIQALGLKAEQEQIDKISPWRFKEPLSPDIAAKKENKAICDKELVKFCHENINVSDYNFIEGAGGVAVPINEEFNTINLMKQLNVEVILVVGTYLGTISHTLTCVECLKYNNIRLNSIIINESENSLNINDIESSISNFTNVPILVNKRNAELGKLNYYN